jgi:small GTP-binding protein
MKILVTGPFHSGKSTFVQKATEMYGIDKNPAMSIDKNETTVALDLGILQLKGLKIFLFGTPGHLRFYSVRKVLSYGADGIIFLIDPSSDHSINNVKKIGDLSITDVEKIWEEINEYLPDLPKVIAVNKQDLPDSEKRSINELKQYFKFMDDNPVIPTSALTGLNLDKAILTIVTEIIDRLKDTLITLYQLQGEVQGIQKAAFKLNKSI